MRSRFRLYRLPGQFPGDHHVYHQYVLRSPHRDRLQQYLANHGVNTLVHYPVPVHLQPAYSGRIECSPDGLPSTESVCREILSIPVHPELDQREVQQVIDALRGFEA